MTSLLGIIPVKIQFHFKTCSRNKNREDKWSKQKARLEKMEMENDNENQKLIKRARGKDEEVVEEMKNARV